MNQTLSHQKCKASLLHLQHILLFLGVREEFLSFIGRLVLKLVVVVPVDEDIRLEAGGPSGQPGPLFVGVIHLSQIQAVPVVIVTLCWSCLEDDEFRPLEFCVAAQKVPVSYVERRLNEQSNLDGLCTIDCWLEGVRKMLPHIFAIDVSGFDCVSHLIVDVACSDADNQNDLGKRWDGLEHSLSVLLNRGDKVFIS